MRTGLRGFAALLFACVACSVDSSGAPGDGGGGSGSGGGSIDAAARDAGPGGGSGDGGFRVTRFVAVGDTGEGNQPQRDVAAAMNTWCEQNGCDFVVVLGDNFYPTGVASTSDSQWTGKFEDVYDLPHLSALRFYSVLGNHDALGNPQAEVDYTALPIGTGSGKRASDRWMMPARYYDVQPTPSVHLFALDTTDSNSTAQQAALVTAAMTSTARWKIAIGHHPRYTAGSHYFDNGVTAGSGFNALQEAVFCHTAVYLSGHDHSRQFYDKGMSSCMDTYFVVSGAGAKVTPRDGLTQAAANATEVKNLFYDATEEGFAAFTAQENALVVDLIDKMGNVDFSFTIPRGQ